MYLCISKVVNYARVSVRYMCQCWATASGEKMPRTKLINLAGKLCATNSNDIERGKPRITKKTKIKRNLNANCLEQKPKLKPKPTLGLPLGLGSRD